MNITSEDLAVIRSFYISAQGRAAIAGRGDITMSREMHALICRLTKEETNIPSDPHYATQNGGCTG